ncbi:MAG: thioredoxin [Spirochaetaceae bacterium]|nr:MAG: thioredoxin [Spirochaetaceae bacterium]
MGKEVTITTANFDAEVTNSDVPVLLDFWAEWCMPCKMIAPVLAQLSDEYDGKLKIGKLDVDSESEIAMKYTVQSIPTLLLFKNGEVVGQHVGAAPKPTIEALFKPHL